MPLRVLLLDDDAKYLDVLVRRVLRGLRGVEWLTTTAPDEAVARAAEVDLLCVDLQLGPDSRDRGGFDVLRQVMLLPPETRPSVIVFSGHDTPADVLTSIQLGARHHWGKASFSQLIAYIEERRREVCGPASERPCFDALLGTSLQMRELRRAASEVAATGYPLLIDGETGTGKELLAQLVHRASRTGTLVSVDCGAFNENLIESTLFGHVRGAFTGAVAHREGLLAKADGGTLFLDEIGNLTHTSQAKCLRVFESGEYQQVGSDAERRWQARLIAATNVPPNELLRRGFRPDLFERISALRLTIPALRERVEDIQVLVDHFMGQLRAPVALTTGGIAALETYRWPGNVRQLRKILQRLDTHCSGRPVGAAEVAHALAQEPDGGAESRPVDGPGLVKALLQSTPEGVRPREHFEALMRQTALDAAGGNVSEAARQTGEPRGFFTPNGPR